jgi:hypothetical protein
MGLANLAPLPKLVHKIDCPQFENRLLRDTLADQCWADQKPVLVVQTEKLNAPDRKAAVFRLDVPLTQLKPGFYTCQVNVIDDAAGQFRFPRLALLVR